MGLEPGVVRTVEDRVSGWGEEWSMAWRVDGM